MHRKIGRFDAYVPDHDPYEIVKKCVGAYSCGGDEKLNSMPHEIHRFFFEIKKEYPELLKDFLFGYDEDFPYSEQVEDAFIRLQEAGYLTRPNPSLYIYVVRCLQSGEVQQSDQDEGDQIASIASKFKSHFMRPQDIEQSNGRL